ncbi:hypothetical protein SSX86_018534 [Deinandra increscens subsp. villosa]|uniref:Hemerythrin-like domain-containing protein n=1 Tax=Deinandra increscens subsp. villosa TaxID=3103831 RepID=A0AAP0CVF5_9ASTR
MGNCCKTTLKKTNYPDHNQVKFSTKTDNPDQVYRKTDSPEKVIQKTTGQSDTLNSLPLPSPSPAPVVRLYGSPTSPATSYIRFALHYKPVTLLLLPSEKPDFGIETPVIQYGSDVISGSSATILRYLDSKFPKPMLLSEYINNEAAVVATATVLQHKSLLWHLERMVRWGEDLAARGGRAKGDPVMGSARMEVKKYGKSYSQLLEVMLEHAQMEEKIVFPVLEREDRGLTKSVNEEHGRDLPLMNGIKEDIKTIIVLDSGSSSCQDALFTLSSRIKSLQEKCKQHFEEEERGVLPLMEAVELTQSQQERLFEQAIDVMASTHSHLLKFFMEGLLPQEAMLYLDLITRCTDKDRVGSIYRFLVEEYQGKRNDNKPTMALLLKAKP